MNSRYEIILNKISLQYPNINFGIIEEYKSIKLVYDGKEMINSKEFFDDICDIAYEHLVGEELNIFAVVYDFSTELIAKNIMTEINNKSRYTYENKVTKFTFDSDLTQVSNNNREALAA